MKCRYPERWEWGLCSTTGSWKAGVSHPWVRCWGALLCIVSQNPVPSSFSTKRQENPAASNTPSQSGPYLPHWGGGRSWVKFPVSSQPTMEKLFAWWVLDVPVFASQASACISLPVSQGLEMRFALLIFTSNIKLSSLGNKHYSTFSLKTMCGI